MNHFFDIGANTGQAVPWLAKDNKHDGFKVWMFEPSPLRIPALVERLRNYQNRYDFVVCPFGLSNRTGVSRFFQKTDTVSDSFTENHGVNDTKAPTLFVAHVDIAEFLQENTLQEDSVELKIDAEGSEYDILLSLLNCKPLLSRVIRISVEWHLHTVLPDFAKARIALLDAYARQNLPLHDWVM